MRVTRVLGFLPIRYAVTVAVAVLALVSSTVFAVSQSDDPSDEKRKPASQFVRFFVQERCGVGIGELWVTSNSHQDRTILVTWEVTSQFGGNPGPRQYTYKLLPGSTSVVGCTKNNWPSNQVRRYRFLSARYE